MMQLLLIIHVIIAVALVGVILLQRSSSDGMNPMGSGGPNAFLSGRGSADALTRATAILATLFIANSLLLGIIASQSQRNVSIIDSIVVEDEATPIPVEEIPTEEESAPVVPLAE